MLPKGFLSAGLFCGIKASGKKDLAVIHSELACNWAGAFTLNSVKAHCVLDNQATLKMGKSVQTIVVNSGNANACTGEIGLKALELVKAETAKVFDLDKNAVLTASTGIIGVPLPAERIVEHLPKIKSQLSSDYRDFADGILTTDLKPKVASKSFNGGSIVGITKGSGMIHPNMATMLAFIVTDFKIAKADLEIALKESNINSFNQISVDGDTSTNDMVLVLANGASGQTIALPQFTEALTQVCTELAKKIVKDGEGATKIFEAKVVGAESAAEARKMALGIVSSSLVKSAIFGNDPNWGRILAAAGQHGKVDLAKASLKIFETNLLQNGQVCNFDKKTLADQMKATQEIKLYLSLGENLKNVGTAWGCDLTYDYVKINAEYTT
jgi:glutamate N-acetyltransferase / amino-acid N-acetyltransferase